MLLEAISRNAGRAVGPLFAAILIAPFIALIPAMGQLQLGGSESLSGTLFLAQGIGSALGLAFAGTPSLRFGMGRSTALGFLILPICAVGFALSPSATWATAAILPLSAFHSAALALAIALVQRDCEGKLRGRFNAYHRGATWLAYAILASIMGATSDAVGLPLTLIGGAAIYVLALIAISQNPATGLRVLMDNADSPAFARKANAAALES